MPVAESSFNRALDAVVHDVRGALSVLALHHTLLSGALDSDEPGAPERRRHWLEVLESARGRLQGVLEALFQHIAPPSDGMLETAKLVGGVATLLDPYATRHKVTLTAVPCPPGLHADADARLIQQILTALLLLSIDATEAGGQITLGAARRSDGIRITLQAAPVKDGSGERAVRAALSAWAAHVPADASLGQLSAASDAGLSFELDLPTRPHG
jgi:signal transduction histidine kinase